MKAVEVAQNALAQTIENGSLYKFVPQPQDRTKEIKYARNSDFTDEVAEEYLDDLISADYIRERIVKRDMSMFYNTIVM